MSSLEENRAIVTRYLREVWDNGDMSVLDELLSPDFRSHSGAQDRQGNREDERRMVASFLEAFGNFKTTILDQLADGDKVCTRWTAVGVHRASFAGVPPTGRTVAMSGMEIARISGGRIVDDWINFDMAELIQQLTGAPATPPTQK